jgi:6-phosphogluconolactonase
LSGAAAAAFWNNSAHAADQPVLFFVGTYTRTDSKGIYAFRFHSDTGKSEPLGLAAESQSPSFLAIHRNGRYLYAVNEVNEYQGSPAGSVSSFAIDGSSGRLTALNVVSSRNSGPAHCALDHTGKWLAVANYGGGSVVVFPVLGEAATVREHTGSSVHPQRQRSPHPHQAVFSPDNRFLLVPDLGTDQVVSYAFDAKIGSLKESKAATRPGGSGPRHLSFDSTGKIVVLASELKSQLTVFDYDAKTGGLLELETISSLAKPFDGQNSAAEIAPLPGTRFWYASNRGEDAIGAFRMDGKKLAPIGEASTGGKTPRHFAIDPTGKFLLAENQGSDRISVLRIDRGAGQLADTGQSCAVSSPTCAAFLGT